MESYEARRIAEVKRNIRVGLTAFIGIVGLLVILSSFYVIDAGERGVVLRFGEVKSVQSEGLHFKVPIFDNVKKFSVRTDKIEREASSASRDLQIVTTQIALNYQLDPDAVDRIYREFGTKSILEAKLVDPAIQDAVKASTAQFNAEELITKRASVKEAIEGDLRERLSS